jgi:hypothetical protein
VDLDVGANACRKFGNPGGHAIEISLESVNVEYQGGGYELLPFAADGAAVHGLDPLCRRVDDGSTTASDRHCLELLFLCELTASNLRPWPGRGSPAQRVFPLQDLRGNP